MPEIEPRRYLIRRGLGRKVKINPEVFRPTTPEEIPDVLKTMFQLIHSSSNAEKHGSKKERLPLKTKIRELRTRIKNTKRKDDDDILIEGISLAIETMEQNFRNSQRAKDFPEKRGYVIGKINPS